MEWLCSLRLTRSSQLQDLGEVPQDEVFTIAEYQSDTGELRWTTTPLLVAAIRGGQRQTQRHQIAFGVKVPDQIADPYDFWLPDEYLPQEELQRQQLNI